MLQALPGRLLGEVSRNYFVIDIGRKRDRLNLIMKKLILSTIAGFFASAVFAFGASEMGFSWNGGTPSQDAQSGDADQTVALYANGVAVIAQPDANDQPSIGDVVVPPGLTDEFEGLESAEAIAARARQLVAQGSNPQLVAAAAIQANRAAGGLPSGDAAIAQAVLGAAPTATPQQKAAIIGYGVELITNPQTFAGIVEGLRSSALAGDDNLATSAQQLDTALAAVNLVFIANATPEFSERLSLAPFDPLTGGEGINANRIGTGLVGGTGQTNPILTGNPLTPPVPNPTPNPTPTPTPTPAPPVTPTQNL